MDIYRDKRVLKWQGGGKRVIRFQSFSYCSAGIKNNTRGVFLGKVGRDVYTYIHNKGCPRGFWDSLGGYAILVIGVTDTA